MHKFTIALDWQGGRNAVGDLQLRHSSMPISIPVEMVGPDEGTNPDEMLLGAAATCYIISLAAILEGSGIKATITMNSDGFVEQDRLLTYKKIIHRPTICIEDASKERLVQRIAEKAERTCMISRALRGNVDIALDVKITIKEG